MTLAEFEFESQAALAIRQALARIPDVKGWPPGEGAMLPMGRDRGFDLVLDITRSGKPAKLLVELSRSGVPAKLLPKAERLVEAAKVQSKVDCPAYPLLCAPYITDETAGELAARGINSVDLAGNCILSLGDAYVQVVGRPNPNTPKDELGALFTRKAMPVLMVLLSAPGKKWKFQELADEAGVSRAQAYKVGDKLKEEGLAGGQRGSFELTGPVDLLKRWELVYQAPVGRRESYFVLPTDPERLARHIAELSSPSWTWALASISAAYRYVPLNLMENTLTVYFKGDLQPLLKAFAESGAAARKVDKGGNLIIVQPQDDTPFKGVRQKDKVCFTSPAQTWLDLTRVRLRGTEAAAAIFNIFKGDWNA